MSVAVPIEFVGGCGGAACMSGAILVLTVLGWCSLADPEEFSCSIRPLNCIFVESILD